MPLSSVKITGIVVLSSMILKRKLTSPSKSGEAIKRVASAQVAIFARSLSSSLFTKPLVYQSEKKPIKKANAKRIIFKMFLNRYELFR